MGSIANPDQPGLGGNTPFPTRQCFRAFNCHLNSL